MKMHIIAVKQTNTIRDKKNTLWDREEEEKAFVLATRRKEKQAQKHGQLLRKANIH